VRIEQVINNLVGNALRFTPKGGEVAIRVALSGFGREEDRTAARAAGFDAFLVKPTDPSRLLEALQT